MSKQIIMHNFTAMKGPKAGTDERPHELDTEQCWCKPVVLEQQQDADPGYLWAPQG